MREIKCLMVLPMQTPRVVTLEVSMQAFSKAVSIGADEELHLSAKKLETGVYMLYATNALFAELEANRKVDDEIISGVFYVIGADEKSLPVSLTSEQMITYMMRFYEPEIYTVCETVSNWCQCALKELDLIAV